MDILHIIIDILRNSILITGLVIVMMMMIEALNIESHGRFFSSVRKTRFGQVVFGAALGLIPGCIGGFATVSLYTRGLLSFGALTAMMISSAGDEAFVMLAMFPHKALALFALLFVLAVITGVLTDIVEDRLRKKHGAEAACGQIRRDEWSEIHGHEDEESHRHEESHGHKDEESHGHEDENAHGHEDEESHRHEESHGHKDEESHGHEDENAHGHEDEESHRHEESHGHKDKESHGHEDKESHGHEDKNAHGHGRRHFGWKRAVLAAGLAVFIAALGSGLLEHEHGVSHGEIHEEVHGVSQEVSPEETGETAATGRTSDPANSRHDCHSLTINLLDESWMNILFACLSVVMLGVIIFASDHFVEEQLWNHVVRKHFLNIFLWTFGVLAALAVLMHFVDIGSWVSDNTALMILLAVAVGIIPESGPHLIFVTLFAAGIVPFPVLLASSISQDGHASIPLLAENGKAFLKAKAINCAVALVCGFTALLFV